MTGTPGGISGKNKKDKRFPLDIIYVENTGGMAYMCSSINGFNVVI